MPAEDDCAAVADIPEKALAESCLAILVHKGGFRVIASLVEIRRLVPVPGRIGDEVPVLQVSAEEKALFA